MKKVNGTNSRKNFDKKPKSFYSRPNFLEEPLLKRVIHAGAWAFGLRIVNQLFSMIRIVILARILSPNDFGLFGIAVLALSALETFSQTGFQAALIQKNEDIRTYLDTAWMIQIIRALIIALILIGTAPFIANFFKTPAANGIIQVVGLSVLFQGFINVGVIYFQKELEFHKEFIYILSGNLADLIFAIVAAFTLRNAWALVFGLLAGNIVRLIVSYLIHPYRPRFRIEGKKVKELYTFGKWILGSSILFFVVTHGDDIFVSKVLGITALGLYLIAYRLSELPVTEITSVVKAVTFPAYSKLQGNTAKLKRAFLQTFEAVVFATLPISIGIFILGPDFIRVFLGSKWTEMIFALQILSISGFIQSITAPVGSLFWAVGQPKIGFIMNATRVLIMGILIYPLSLKLGITGTALSVLAGSIMKVPIFLTYAKKIMGVDVSELWTRIRNYLVINLSAGLFTLIFQRSLYQPGLMFFIEESTVFIIIFVTISYLIWKHYGIEPLSIFKQIKRQAQGE